MLRPGGVAAIKDQPGDLLLAFFIWYGSVRFVVETLKADNWRLFGVPTAQIVAAITVLGAAAILVARHARAPRVGPPSAVGGPQVGPGG